MKAVIIYWIDGTATNFKMSDSRYEEFHNWLYLGNIDKPYEAGKDDKIVVVLKAAIKYIQVSQLKDSDDNTLI